METDTVEQLFALANVEWKDPWKKNFISSCTGTLIQSGYVRYCSSIPMFSQKQVDKINEIYLEYFKQFDASRPRREPSILQNKNGKLILKYPKSYLDASAEYVPKDDWAD